MPNRLFLLVLLATCCTQIQAKEAAADNYKAYCVQCHGSDGKGGGVNVREIAVVPRDHTDVKSMSGRSDETLFKAIKEGGASIDKSILMPPWDATLSDEEIKDMVQDLRVLCKCNFGS